MGDLHGQKHYGATTMGLVAYLDERRVEMEIGTANGEKVVMAFANDAIFKVEQQIARMGQDCPEIASRAAHSASCWPSSSRCCCSDGSRQIGPVCAKIGDDRLSSRKINSSITLGRARLPMGGRNAPWFLADRCRRRVHTCRHPFGRAGIGGKARLGWRRKRAASETERHVRRQSEARFQRAKPSLHPRLFRRPVSPGPLPARPRKKEQRLHGPWPSKKMDDRPAAPAGRHLP